MIEKSFPSTKPTTYQGYYSPPRVPQQQQLPHRLPTAANTPIIYERDRARAATYGITIEEFMRRDAIVRDLFLKCNWKPGDVLWPYNEENRRRYGRCTLRGVYKSYHDFHVEEAKRWPKDDIPLICTVETSDPGKVILTTPGWLCIPASEKHKC